ncbi:MAG: hypothetical protein J6K50_04085, partial [Clostridia bacterium]|nr:hypothetical protein [Clostridia bacterium]
FSPEIARDSSFIECSIDFQFGAPKKERKLKNLRSFLVLIQKRPDPLYFRKRIGVIISDF